MAVEPMGHFNVFIPEAVGVGDRVAYLPETGTFHPADRYGGGLPCGTVVEAGARPGTARCALEWGWERAPGAGERLGKNFRLFAETFFRDDP